MLQTTGGGYIKIDILSDNKNGGGSNVVLPPSKHASGDIYEFNKIPEEPDDIPTMPEKFKEELLKLLEFDNNLKISIQNSRSWIEDFIRKGETPHGGDGRRLMLALCTELLYNGLTKDEIHFVAILIYGDEYDKSRTSQELKYIEGKPWKSTTLIGEFPEYCNEENTRMTFNMNFYFEKKKGLSVKALAEDIMDVHSFMTFIDQIYVYKNGVYVPNGEHTVEAEVQLRLGDKSRKTHINEVLNFIRIATRTDRNDLIHDTRYINVKNGILDRKQKKLLPHSPDFKSVDQIPANFNPKAKCPAIERFFRDVLRPEDIQAMFEWFGYCLVPDTRMQKAVLMIGEGANGKSVMIHLLVSFIGKENASFQSLHNLEQNRYATAELNGKLINVHPDLSSSTIREVSIFKELTGNEYFITAEKKYFHPFEFRNTARLTFSANRAPKIASSQGDGDYSFHRRLMIFPFDNIFEGSNIDLNLQEKLTTENELSGLLNLTLEALDRLEANDTFSYERSVKETQRNYNMNSDSIALFCDERVEACEGVHTPKDDVYQAYKSWCDDDNIKPKKKNTFCKVMQKLGYEQIRTYIKGENKRIMCYRDFSLARGETKSL